MHNNVTHTSTHGIKQEAINQAAKPDYPVRSFQLMTVVLAGSLCENICAVRMLTRLLELTAISYDFVCHSQLDKGRPIFRIVVDALGLVLRLLLK